MELRIIVISGNQQGQFSNPVLLPPWIARCHSNGISCTDYSSYCRWHTTHRRERGELPRRWGLWRCREMRGALFSGAFPRGENRSRIWWDGAGCPARRLWCWCRPCEVAGDTGGGGYREERVDWDTEGNAVLSWRLIFVFKEKIKLLLFDRSLSHLHAPFVR